MMQSTQYRPRELSSAIIDVARFPEPFANQSGARLHVYNWDERVSESQ